MKSSLKLFYTFCKTPSLQQNYFKNFNQNLAYLSYLPHHWDESSILSHFQSAHINSAKIIKNRLGQPTGNALLEFSDEQSCQDFIQKNDQTFLELSQEVKKIGVKAFALKTQKHKTQVDRQSNTVHMFNLQFDCKTEDLYQLAYDFGDVLDIDLPIKKGVNKNKGYASIKFKTNKQAENFQQYYQNKQFQGRNIRIQIKELEFDTQKKQRKEEEITDIKDVLKKANLELLQNQDLLNT